jgi:hypothetical protein
MPVVEALYLMLHYSGHLELIPIPSRSSPNNIAANERKVSEWSVVNH